MITYLYHKRHRITGLNYFGKAKHEPLKYSGSGVYWTAHLKKHGKNIETVQIWQFEDEQARSKFAIQFSKENNIVESKLWANLCIEDGRMGGDKFSQMPKDRLLEINSRKSKSQYRVWQSRDRNRTAETVAKIWDSRDDETKTKIYQKVSNTLKNKTVEEREQIKSKRRATEARQTKEFKEDAARRRKETLLLRPVRTCLHCGLQGKSQNMDRYHFSNCRFISSE